MNWRNKMKGSNTNISEQIEYLEALTEVLPRENYMKLYDIICEAEDANDAKERVMEFFEFSEAQAQYVLDMKIETFSLDEAKRLKMNIENWTKFAKCWLNMQILRILRRNANRSGN